MSAEQVSSELLRLELDGRVAALPGGLYQRLEKGERAVNPIPDRRVIRKGDAMYDILVYLFENCQQAELAYDRERVAKKLSAAGFEDSDISEALHWLAGVRARRRAGCEPLPDSRARLPRLRAARAGEARRAVPRLPADARAVRHPQRRRRASW